MIGKKSQIEVTFNWIYIAIAGAVIILFFVGIVMRQAQVSEEKLSADIVRIMNSILTGAGVSEKTKNTISSSGLVDYTLYFTCEGGISELGIKGKSARQYNAIDPVFVPGEIHSTQIILWSLPYMLPFKVADFLLVAPVNRKFYLLSSDMGYVEEFLNVTEGFNREYIDSIEEIELSGDLSVRIIDADGMHIPFEPVPASLQPFDDSRVSAIVLREGEADYYQKDSSQKGNLAGGSSWKKLNKEPIKIISLGGERDAAKYAAIFAENDQVYQCNMLKAFKRLGMVTEIYGGSNIGSGEIGGKLKEMIDYYEMRPELSLSTECTSYLTASEGNAVLALTLLKNKAKACELGLNAGGSLSACTDLISAAAKVKQVNKELRLSCITLY
ncbi:MAG: hypothetical protein AB1668_02430 [Nanoarchaeota archaeon]